MNEINKDSKDLNQHIKNISNILNNTTSDKRMRRTHRIFLYVINHAPCNIYEISRDTEINYTSVNTSIREMEFLGLIKIRVELTDKNRAEKIIVVPEDILEKYEKIREEKE